MEPYIFVRSAQDDLKQKMSQSGEALSNNLQTE
jgi:hypothetical protein